MVSTSHALQLLHSLYSISVSFVVKTSNHIFAKTPTSEKWNSPAKMKQPSIDSLYSVNRGVHCGVVRPIELKNSIYSKHNNFMVNMSRMSPLRFVHDEILVLWIKVFLVFFFPSDPRHLEKILTRRHGTRSRSPLTAVTGNKKMNETLVRFISHWWVFKYFHFSASRRILKIRRIFLIIAVSQECSLESVSRYHLCLL